MRKLLTAACLCALLSVPIAAQDGTYDDDYDGMDFFRGRVGIRAGFGLNPDQFAFGIQAVMGQVFEVVRFAPNIDMGFGDDLTVAAITADFRAPLFTPPNSSVTFYGAVGPTLALLIPEGDADNDTEIGLSFTAGASMPMGGGNAYNLEAKFGIGDIPEFKLLFGVLFGGADLDSRTLDEELDDDIEEAGDDVEDAADDVEDELDNDDLD